jgi:hypothetical protein
MGAAPYALTLGPYGLVLAVLWDRSTDAVSLAALGSRPAGKITASWALPGVHAPHDLTLAAAPLALTAAGERRLAVLVAETRQAGSGIRKLVLLPEGFEGDEGGGRGAPAEMQEGQQPEGLAASHAAAKNLKPVDGGGSGGSGHGGPSTGAEEEENLDEYEEGDEGEELDEEGLTRGDLAEAQRAAKGDAAAHPHGNNAKQQQQEQEQGKEVQGGNDSTLAHQLQGVGLLMSLSRPAWIGGVLGLCLTAFAAMVYTRTMRLHGQGYRQAAQQQTATRV